MTYLAMTVLAFALAAGVNTASVASQMRTGFWTRRFGANGWYLHLAITAVAWGVFVLLAFRLDRHLRWHLPDELAPVGLTLLIIGIGLWISAFVQLGPERVANGYFFGRGSKEPVEEGVFRWLKNPMYDSYVVVFVGLALWRSNAAYLVLAIESFLLLNVMESRVENRPFKAGRG